TKGCWADPRGCRLNRIVRRSLLNDRRMPAQQCSREMENILRIARRLLARCGRRITRLMRSLEHRRQFQEPSVVRGGLDDGEAVVLAALHDSVREESLFAELSCEAVAGVLFENARERVAKRPDPVGALGSDEGPESRGEVGTSLCGFEDRCLPATPD